MIQIQEMNTVRGWCVLGEDQLSQRHGLSPYLERAILQKLCNRDFQLRNYSPFSLVYRGDINSFSYCSDEDLNGIAIIEVSIFLHSVQQEMEYNTTLGCILIFFCVQAFYTSYPEQIN